MREVLELLRSSKATVGFLPDEAVRQRVLNGTLLVAVDGSNIVGYLLYDLPRNGVTVRQLVVSEQARNAGVARALIDELVNRHQETQREILLTCRRDFPANQVWPRLGFAPLHERPGRGAKGTTLTVWHRSFDQPDLFTLLRDSETRPLAAVDTNLVIRAADGSSSATDLFSSDWIRDEVRFGVTPQTRVEIYRQEDRLTRRRHANYLGEFEELRPSPAAVSLRDAMMVRLGSRANPHGDDITVAAQASAAGARWLVTDDRPFRRACGEAVREVGSLELVTVSEMMLILDQLVRGEGYSGTYLLDTDIAVREVMPSELEELARTFVNQRHGDSLGAWRRHLEALASDVGRTRLEVFCDAEDLLAVVAITKGAVLEICACRVRRGPAEPTISRQVLGWLRERCLEAGAAAVQITDPHPSYWVENRSIVEGYLPEAEPIAVPLAGIGTIADVADVLSREPLRGRMNKRHAAKLQELEPTPEAAHSVESVFHPFVVTGARLRTVRVPIGYNYARELFDHSLSVGELFHRDRSPALRREHVYFRSPGSVSMFRPPGRLLWYVTGDRRYGGRTLRGWSLLDDSVVGDVEYLIHRFSHLGVLDHDEIRSMASKGSVMALRFSHTTVFRRPVTLDQYVGVMSELEPGTGLTHAGPQPVSEQVFVRLINLGT